MKPSQDSNKDINYGIKDHKALGKQIRDYQIAPASVGNHLKLAARESNKAVYSFSRGLIHTQQSKEQFLDEAQQLFDTSVKMDSTDRTMVLKAMIDETGRAGSLFLIQNMAMLKKKDARACMKDFMSAGGGMTDIAVWMQHAGHVLRKHNVKASDTAEVVVDALGDAAEWLVDALEDGVDAIIEAIDAIIDAATDVGAALVDLFEDVVDWTIQEMGDLLAALIELGRDLGEFVGATFDWAYAAVSNFVAAAFEVGFRIADLLATVVSESYFVLRRFVNGIIENLGPIGEVFDFILTQVENATDRLWRSTLLAIRFAEGTLQDALDWASEQSQMVMEAMVRAWESIGEALETLYEWANTAGALVWRAIGEATATIGNSIYYAYNFLTTSAIPFIFDYTRGLIAAGVAIGGLIGWAVGRTVEIAAEVIRAALDTGITIGTMLVEIARDPGSALETFIQGMQEVGQTLDDLFEAVIIDTAEEFLEEVVEALLELEEAIIDMGRAILRVSAAALAGFIAHLFSQLGSYRGLLPEEEADGRTVFGNSLDYQNVFLSTEDPLNFIIFGVQDLFTQEPDSRAFVTINLINFDVTDGPIDRPTLIHELTHIWQSRTVGGIYMAEAIIAQTDLGSGYNYGYDDFRVEEEDVITMNDRYDGTTTTYDALGFILGRNGEQALDDANGDFEAFNREQQGQIMMHWFVRTQLELTDFNGDLVSFDASSLDPYQQFVASA